jgi:hypothetical protein
VKYKRFLSFFAFLVAIMPLHANSWGIPSNPRETIFLLTDRDLYVAGENLFFDLTLFSEPHIQGRTSGFAYLALRNERGIIQRAAVELDDQQAHGNIYLPDTLSSGYYELIAFTNWMRNAGEEWYFRKPLYIANRFDTGLETLFPPADTSPKVSFFPEGGALVSGVENKVLMVSNGEFDASFRKVTILSERGDTLAQTRLNEHGWATIPIIPQSGLGCVAYLEGTDETFRLPAPSDSGAAFHAFRQNGNILVSVEAQPEKTFSGNLTFEQNGQVIRQFSLNLAAGQTHSQSFPEHELPRGLILIKLNQNGGIESGKRFWYHPANPAGPQFSLNGQFSKREKIVVDIQKAGQMAPRELNITLARKEAFQDASLGLQSWQNAMDLARALQMEPNKALEAFGALSPEAINQRLACITAKEGFDFSNAPERNVFFMETNQLIVSGKVSRSLDGSPLENVRIILSTPDTLVNLRYSRTNDQGEFQFLLDGYYNDRELVFTPDPETYIGLIDIEIFDKFVFQKPFEKSWFKGLAAKKEYLLQAQEVVSVNKAFGISSLGASLTPEQYYFTAPRLFANPVSLIRLDNYAPLSDLREISRELIPAWRIRQNGDEYRHTIVSANEREQLEGSPILFVDGIVTYDLAPLIELNSATLTEIQVHNLEWMHGEMYFPGIIALFTRENIWQELDLKPSPTIVFHDAPCRPGRFVSPRHDNEANTAAQPDLRNLLFWEPSLRVRSDRDTQLEFFAGDLSGEYLLTIQGLCPDGKAIHFQKVITIKP